jgi:hypothetical protein
MDQIQRAYCLTLKDFDLNIPPGAAIHQVRADFYGHREGSSVLTTSVNLIGPGGQRVGRSQSAWVRGDDWPMGVPGDDGHWWYGDNDQNWGTTLTPDFLNHPDFGIQFQVRKPIGRDTTIVRLDQVKLTVSFTPLYTICHDSCTIFYVDPVPGAYYKWTLPSRSFLVSDDPSSNIINLNVEKMEYGLHEICVETISGFGTSDPCCMTFRLAECGRGNIGDRLWQDNNKNGLQDPGEDGLANIPVHLYDVMRGRLQDTARTNADGLYFFDDIPEGHYYVRAIIPMGLEVTDLYAGPSDRDSDFDESNGPYTSRTFFLSSGEDLRDIDGGFTTTTGIGDLIWEDQNRNGLQDIGEAGLENVMVMLFTSGGQVVDTTWSTSSGAYRFDNVAPGDYLLDFEIPAGSLPTSRVGGGAINSDIGSDGRTPNFTLGFGDVIDSLDAGFVFLSKINGLAWYDRDHDGLREAGEPLMAGRRVILTTPQGQEEELTNSEGEYCFDSLFAESYSLQFIGDTSEIFSPQNVGGNDDIDSDVDPSGSSGVIALSARDTVIIDIGLRKACSIEVGTVTLEDDLPCYGSSSFLLTFSQQGRFVLPSGFELAYLLAKKGEDVVAVSNVPVFSFGDIGTYEVVALVYDPNPTSYDFFDITALTSQGITIEEIISLIDSQSLCAGITPALAFDIENCSSLGGTIWRDQNQDGIRQPAEDMVGDVAVQLTDRQGQILASDTTSANGQYLFDQLGSGDYQIRVVLPPGVRVTAKDNGPDDIDSDLDQAGQSDLIGLAAGDEVEIDGGFIFECDANASTWVLQQFSEPCFSGSSIRASFTAAVAPILPAGYELIYFMADENGRVLQKGNDTSFDLDQPGRYQFFAFVYDARTTSADYFDISLVVEGVTAVDEIKEAIEQGFLCASLSRPAHAQLEACGEITGQVWEDDGDGLRLPFEGPLPGIAIDLLDAQNLPIAQSTTDSLGRYAFRNLVRGIYRVSVNVPFDLLTSPQDVGNDDAIDSDVDVLGLSDPLILLAGSRLVVDAGLTTDCDVAVGYIDSLSTSVDCWNGQAFTMSAIEIDRGVIPQDFELIYFMSRDGWIYDTSSIPSFELDSFGVFCIHPLIYDPRPGSPDYLDIDIFLGQPLTTDEAFELIFENDRCADFDIDGLCIEVVKCVGIGDRVWIDDDRNGIQDPSESGVNDITVELFDRQGSLLFTTETRDSSGLPGYFQFMDLVPDEYYLKFDLPTGYEWTLPNQGNDIMDSDVTEENGPGTTPTFFAFRPMNDEWDAGLVTRTASIGDFVWDDLNADGIQDTGEPGINGVSVKLFEMSGQIVDSTMTKDIPGTSRSGFYQFHDVIPGQYYLEFGEVSGRVQTLANAGNDDGLDSDVDNSNGFGTTAQITLSAGETEVDCDAGYIDPSLLKSSIGNYVWLDRDVDGIQDGFENGVDGIRVELYDVNDQMVASTETAPHPQWYTPGYYRFDDIEAGQYYVIFRLTREYEFSPSFAGFDDDRDSDISHVKGYGSTNLMAVYAGEEKMSVDAGLVQIGSLGDFVWLDDNADGVQDPNEMGVNDVLVSIYDRDGAFVDSTRTYSDTLEGDGYYVFRDLVPSGYYLHFDLPAGHAFTEPNSGGDDTRDSDVNHSNGFGTTSIVNISPGEHDRDADAGIYPQGALGRRTWLDANQNGIYDAGLESGMPGLQVYLYDDRDSMYDATLTDTSGRYTFEKIPMGDYYVKFVLPVDYDFAPSGRGAEDQDCDVTHRNGYGTTDLMAVYPGQSYFMLDAGVVLAGVLPVDLLNFDVSEDQGMVRVRWKVGHEVDVSRYVVERRHELENDFKDLGDVLPNPAAFGSYEWPDHLEDMGVYYYRLRIIDTDGSDEYSHVKSIDHRPAASGMTIYPNPAADRIRIQTDHIPEEGLIIIRTMDGKLWSETVWTEDEVDVSQVPAGVYSVELVSVGRVLYRDRLMIVR